MLWPNGSKTRPTITSGYGWRIHPVTHARKLHAGVDLTGFSLVRAIEAGVVVAVGTPRGWEGGGIQVWIQHSGYLSRSMHLKNTPAVRVGEAVVEGRILGVVGMTGTATGVHHHLEIVVNGAQIDPIPFITARIAAAAGNTTKTTPTKPQKETDMAMQMIRDTDRGSITIADEFGVDAADAYRSVDINGPEYLTAQQKAFGAPIALNAREWDIVNAIASRRWAQKKAEIVAAVVEALKEAGIR